MRKRHAEGVESMWAMARWRNGRLRFRRGLPPGLLALFCGIGLHFMIRSFEMDGYACRCRHQHLWNEQLWRGPRTGRSTAVNVESRDETRIFWVPQVSDPDRPTMRELEGASPLDSFIAHPHPDVPASFPNADALIAELVADTGDIPIEMRQGAFTTADPPASFSEQFQSRFGDLLNRIDRAVDGLCPCGAEPREGSAYCSYDCEPNIVGEHTDLSAAGSHAYATPMRWRPDLVSGAPDEGLTPIGVGERLHVGGGLFRSAFRRNDGTVHLRLDDGHRFVGADIPADVEVPGAYGETWQRLERELTNPRRTIRTTPDRNSFIESVLPLAMAAGFTPRAENPDTLWSRWCSTCRTRGEPLSQPAGDWCCWTRLPGPALSLSVSVDFSGTRRMMVGAGIGSQYRSVERTVTEADLVSALIPLDVVRAMWVEMEDEILAAVGIIRATARRPIAAGQMVTSDDINLTGPAYVRPLPSPYSVTVNGSPELFRITGNGT